MGNRLYKWEDLTWKQMKNGVRVAHLSLYPGDVLQVEVGWEITGPQRVTIAHHEGAKYTHVRYKKLRKSEFNIDNPLEYPCADCKAERFSPCDESCKSATYRVFLTKGGVL